MNNIEIFALITLIGMYIYGVLSKDAYLQIICPFLIILLVSLLILINGGI